ncbi:MAG: hypothetical protein DMG65_04130 [Candidatus Angelobacter sp. Gp1-AA117]|nr:MAG: hypothetical protein DMG65_04130 [Candidatus Angelobacter sp. Gp1-AA117]
MSRFFNESRKASRHVTVGPRNVDLQEHISRLREGLETHSRPSSSQVRQVLAPLEDANNIASQVVAARLENCRSIRLPRDNEQLLLVPQYNLPMQQAMEAYQTLRTRLVKHEGRHGMRSLVISSAAPGDGKTLTAFNMALCFARIQNWPVLLVDADLRTQGMSSLLGRAGAAGLADILESDCAYDQAVLQTDVPDLYVLPAGKSSTPAPELFSRAAWKEFIGWSSESFKLVLIDSPPMLDLADFELIASPCEAVMLVARSGKTSLETFTKTCARVDPKKLAGVVLNACEEVGDKDYKYYRYAVGGPSSS